MGKHFGYFTAVTEPAEDRTISLLKERVQFIISNINEVSTN